MPSFEAMTLRHGTVLNGRFTGDGQGLVDSAAWDGGPLEVFTMSVGARVSTPLPSSGADLLSVSHDRKRPRSCHNREIHLWVW